MLNGTHYFPENYGIAWISVRETRLGYRFILQGATHANCMTTPEQFSFWAKRPKEDFPSLRHAANWAAHSKYGKSILTCYDGMIILNDWKKMNENVNVHPDVCKRIAVSMREKYGERWLYKSKEAQKALIKLIKQHDK